MPAHLTDAQKGDPAVYGPGGDLLRFHRNAPGHPNGSRHVLAAGEVPPAALADRFEVFRPGRLAVAAGDRLRVTAGGKTRDGKHRLDTGDLLTVARFTPRGDLVDARGWVVGREFGHLAHGYVVTSHASQGKTVDKVFVAQSAASLPATNARQFYVSVSRGREQAVVFTDDKAALRDAVRRPDEPPSATAVADAARRTTPLRGRLHKHLAFVRRSATFARTYPPARTAARPMTHAPQENAHER